MTLRLWRALNDPPATHPIFVRTVLLPTAGRRRPFNSASLIIRFVMAMSEFMPTLLLLLMPAVLGGCGLIYGLDCAVRISQQITAERKNNTYDLLALCPQGALAVCWALCTSLLYQERQFTRLCDIIRTSVQIASAAIAIIVGLFLAVSLTIIISSAHLALPIIVPLINAEAVVILIYAEFVQSTVMGCLSGLLISTFTSSPLDSALYAPAVFLLLKLSSYGIGVLVGFNLTESIYQQSGIQNSLLDIVLTVVRVALIMAVQDGIIRVLWRLVIHRTDTPAHDSQAALDGHG